MEVYIHTYINVIYIYMCVCVCIERERKEETAISWYDHFSPSPQLNWFRIITAVSWVFLLCFSEWSSFFYFCSLSFTCTVLLSNHQVIHGNSPLRTLCWWLVKARMRDNFLRPMRLRSRRQPHLCSSPSLSSAPLATAGIPAVPRTPRRLWHQGLCAPLLREGDVPSLHTRSSATHFPQVLLPGHLLREGFTHCSRTSTPNNLCSLSLLCFYSQPLQLPELFV